MDFTFDFLDAEDGLLVYTELQQKAADIYFQHAHKDPGGLYLSTAGNEECLLKNKEPKYIV